MLSRDHPEFTLACLNSLLGISALSEWIIIDNGSTPATKEQLKTWTENHSDRVNIIWNDRDPGGCHARNQGLMRAQNDLVLFLDNDILSVDLCWLEKLVAPLSVSAQEPTNKPVAATAPLLLFPGPQKIIQSAGGGVTSDGRVGLLGRGEIDGETWRRRRLLAWAPTAALLVRRDVALQVGGFDESFDPVPVCEDIDFCCRLRADGNQILFVGDAQLRHFENITFNHVPVDKRAYWVRHLRIIKERWPHVLANGPISSANELAWKPIEKSYDRLESPSVRVLNLQEGKSPKWSFFAPFLPTSDDTLPDLRICVMGCGQAALRGALPCFSPPGSPQAAKAASFLSFGGTNGIIISAVCDTDLEKARTAAQQFNVARTEISASHLFEDVPTEGLCICTPPETHAHLCWEALRRNIGILVEKPPVVNIDELQRLVQTYRQFKPAVFMVNLPWAFHPAIHQAAAQISQGILGRLITIEAIFEHGGPASWAPNAKWYFTKCPETLILDLGLHVAFAIEQVTGIKMSSLDEVQIGNPHRAIAKGRAGGLPVLATVAWDAPVPRFTIDVHGENGRMLIRLLPWQPNKVVHPIQIWHERKLVSPYSCQQVREGNPYSVLPVNKDAYAGGPYEHFISCLRTMKLPLTDFDMSSNAMEWVLRWCDSAENIACS
jgi:predicted dehydrogenase/GT2 family glycosyltransferase